MTDVPKVTLQARQALLDEICSQLLSPDCGLFVEDMLPRLPNYDSEELLDLIDAELCRRTDRGESPGFEEFAGRFPKLSMETLAQLFEVHLLESGARARETPNFQLPGIVQGGLLSRCPDGEIRRARPESTAQWIAVRVFETANWGADLQTAAATWIESVATFEHSHLLNYLPPVRSDACGNLYAWLPNAEGTRLTIQTVRPLTPQQAATYLLPVAGAFELAREQGVWLGNIQVEYLQVDHFNRLRLLGSGALSRRLIQLIQRLSANDDQALKSAQESEDVLHFGELWEQMIGRNAWTDDDPITNEERFGRERALAMAVACKRGIYATFSDFIDDLNLMRQLGSSTSPRARWKCDASLKTKNRWLPWR